MAQPRWTFAIERALACASDMSHLAESPCTKGVPAYRLILDRTATSVRLYTDRQLKTHRTTAYQRSVGRVWSSLLGRGLPAGTRTSVTNGSTRARLAKPRSDGSLRAIEGTPRPTVSWRALVVFPEPEPCVPAARAEVPGERSALAAAAGVAYAR